MAHKMAIHVMPVMKLFDATRMLHVGTWLGDVLLVESLKQVQEMLWMNSGLSHWDSDVGGIIGCAHSKCS